VCPKPRLRCPQGLVYAQVKKHYEPIISARYSGGDNLRILPLIVVANGCADRDPEVHRLLMDMVSPLTLSHRHDAFGFIIPWRIDQW